MFVVADLAWAEEISHIGVTTLLGVAVGILWRSWHAERKANSDYTKEFVTHVAEMNQIPEAIDRLRTDIMDELRAWRR